MDDGETNINEAETAVISDCHCLSHSPGYIAVRMSKVMAEPRVWCVLFTRASDLMAVYDPTLLFLSHKYFKNPTESSTSLRYKQSGYENVKRDPFN